MFAYPIIIFRSGDDGVFNNGTIFPLPFELRDKQRLEKYSALTKSGWHTLEHGYASYVAVSSVGTRFVVPGQMVAGARIAKRFHGYTRTVAKTDVERFVSDIIEFEDTTTSVAKSDLNTLVHDLRGLSNVIYNSAEGAKIALENSDQSAAKSRVENVLAAQGMLSMRTDALDFLGNPASVIINREISIYRKVDKVVRCFNPRAFDFNKRIILKGPSSKYVRGPDIFELVPYAIIDNAIKYSPSGSEISVDVSDNPSPTLRISSYGPKIEDDEISEIFMKGRRGVHAMSSEVAGSGVGLHLVNKLVTEYFGGEISVRQSGDVNINGVQSMYTTFTVVLPNL